MQGTPRTGILGQPLVKLKVSGSLNPLDGGFLILAGHVKNCPPELEPRIRKAVEWFEKGLKAKIDAATRELSDRTRKRDT